MRTDKETILELNGCVIEAFPSNHLDAFRSLTNPKFILLDEADFFRKSEQEDVRHVSERYIAKSDPFIVMVSTPYAPDGLFDRIEKEPEETCIYKRPLSSQMPPAPLPTLPSNCDPSYPGVCIPPPPN
jgi:hypothetical protein